MSFITSLASNICYAFTAVGVKLLGDHFTKQAPKKPVAVNFSSVLNSPRLITKIVEGPNATLPCVQLISRDISAICPSAKADPSSCVFKTAQLTILTPNKSQMATDQYDVTCTQICNAFSESFSPHTHISYYYTFEIQKLPAKCMTEDLLIELKGPNATLRYPEILDTLDWINQPRCSRLTPLHTIEMDAKAFRNATLNYYQSPLSSPPDTIELVLTSFTAITLESYIDSKYNLYIADGWTKQFLVAFTKTATVVGLYCVAGQSVVPYIATRIAGHCISSVARRCWNCFKSKPRAD